jgi:hypothetical protein
MYYAVSSFCCVFRNDEVTFGKCIECVGARIKFSVTMPYILICTGVSEKSVASIVKVVCHSVFTVIVLRTSNVTRIGFLRYLLLGC